MKIKTQKQLNLPQLIEWALKNEIKNTYYVSKNRYIVTFDKIGFLESATLPLDEIFTVEVEEEITEDTVLPTLIERRDFGNELTYSRYEYVRIKDIKGRNSTVFYTENDDYTMTLIWRDGKLVA